MRFCRILIYRLRLNILQVSYLSVKQWFKILNAFSQILGLPGVCVCINMKLVARFKSWILLADVAERSNDSQLFNLYQKKNYQKKNKINKCLTFTPTDLVKGVKSIYPPMIF